MAAIGKIRSWGPWLVGIIALALFGFIAGDMWRSCETTSNMSRQQAGEVLGEKLNIQDYNTMIDTYQESSKLAKEILTVLQDRRAEYVGENQSGDDMDNLRDLVWNKYAQSIIIGEEAEELGLIVTDDELAKVLQQGTNPALSSSYLLLYPYLPYFNRQENRFEIQPLFFDANMRFDYQQVKQLSELLKKQGEKNPQFKELSDRFQKFWESVEKDLKQQLLVQKYEALIAACMQSNTVSAKAAFDGTQTQSRVELAFYPYASVNDNDVKVTDADLKKKYEEKKAAFEIFAEQRDVKYVTYQVVPSQADRDRLTASISQAAELLKKDSLKTEDAVRRSQSLVPYNGMPVSLEYLENQLRGIGMVIDSMEIGEVSPVFETHINRKITNPEERAKSSLAVVKLLGKPVVVDSVEVRAIPVPDQNTADSVMQVIRGGEDFDTLSVHLYGRPTEKRWMTMNAMLGQQMTADEKNYWNTVMGLRAGDMKSLAVPQANYYLVYECTDAKSAKELYDVAIVIRDLDASNETYNNEFNRFSRFVAENQSADKLEKNAASKGYTVSTANGLTTASHNIAGISGTHQAIKWLFETAKEGQVSQAFERCGNNDKFVAVALKKIHPVGVLDFESVKEQLRPEVLIDKKYEFITKRLSGVHSVAEAQEKDQAVQVETVPGIKFAEPASVRNIGISHEPALSGAVAATAEGAFCKKPVKGNAGVYLFQVLERTVVPGEFNDANVQRMLRYQQRRLSGLAYGELWDKAKIVDNRYLFR